MGGRPPGLGGEFRASGGGSASPGFSGGGDFPSPGFSPGSSPGEDESRGDFDSGDDAQLQGESSFASDDNDF